VINQIFLHAKPQLHTCYTGATDNCDISAEEAPGHRFCNGGSPQI
jgi:hypothetical protein